MAITECGRGHVYDSDQYAACPYCNQGSNVIDFGDANDNRTVAPGVEYPANRTIPVRGIDPFYPGDEGKTVSPLEMRKKKEEENKTVVVFKQAHNYDPVVGWLVCIEGKDKGKDYRLMARINTVGRSDRMDICIRNDNTVSKENHARVAYDPKNNIYLVSPDKNINNIYVNNQPIFAATQINAYDVLEFGESKFIFIPLCNDRFEWEIGLKPVDNQ